MVGRIFAKLHGPTNEDGRTHGNRLLSRLCLARLVERLRDVGPRLPGKLGVGLRELDDWICCGATAAHSLNHKLAVALPARNLALAKRDGMTELLAPCPMCSMELLRANRALAACPRLQKEISEIVELDVDGSTQVLNLIQVVQKIGLERFAGRSCDRWATFVRPVTTAAC